MNTKRAHEHIDYDSSGWVFGWWALYRTRIIYTALIVNENLQLITNCRFYS